MRLKEYFESIYRRWVFNNKNSLVERNIAIEKYYISQLHKKNQAKLKEPNSYLLRSFLQYKCQMYIISRSIRIAFNLISPLLILIFVPYTLLYACFLKPQVFEENLAVINGDVDNHLVPISLQEQYQLIKCHQNFRFRLDLLDLIWILKTCNRYLLHPYFLFKLSVKVAQYSYLIACFHPKAIVTTSEYSFCSSALTRFCEDRGVQHVNIMHGEKGFNIRDSFFQFSRCYVWEDYYVGLFEQLKADESQFIVERPPKHQKIIALGKTSIPLKNTIKFYWGSEYNSNELSFISEHLKRIKKIGFHITVRYHPLHEKAFYQEIYPFVSDFKIEDPRQVTLYDSLQETEYAAGTYSTVLYEAYLMNRKLIINDFDYPSLLALSCISVHLPHNKLSEFKVRQYV